MPINTVRTIIQIHEPSVCCWIDGGIIIQIWGVRAHVVGRFGGLWYNMTIWGRVSMLEATVICRAWVMLLRWVKEWYSMIWSRQGSSYSTNWLRGLTP